MTFSLLHRIADVTIRTESFAPLPHLEGERFERFRVKQRKPDVWQRVHELDASSPSLPPLDAKERRQLVQCVAFAERWLESPVFRDAGVRAAARRCLDAPELSHLELAWNRVMVRNFARNELDLFLPQGRQATLSDLTFVAGFRNMVGTFLPNFGAVMIHGAAAVRGRRAAVFVAPDGGGKTTVMRGVKGESVLSDDHIVLKDQGGVTMVHATPLGQLTGGPGAAPLGALFALEKADHFELKPVHAREVLQFICEEQAFKWHVLPMTVRKRTFELLHAACYAAPAYQVRFPIKGVDWDAIDEALST